MKCAFISLPLLPCKSFTNRIINLLPINKPCIAIKHFDFATSQRHLIRKRTLPVVAKLQSPETTPKDAISSTTNMSSHNHSPDHSPAKKNVARRFLQNAIFMGFEPSPDLLAIMIVYFVQGILGISRLAVNFFLKDSLHLSPTEVAALTGLTTIPWMIKPLYGFLSDTVPIYGYKRRSYLILSAFMGAFSWAALSTVVDTPKQALIAVFLASMSVAISDVIADSLVVQRARLESPEKAGSLQSLCWGSSAFGGLLSAYFSGSLLETMTTRQVFALTALLPALNVVVSFFMAEKPVTREKGITNALKTQALDLWSAISQKNVWLPTLFLFAWQATPSQETAMFFFNTNELHFQPEFLGRVRLVSSVASLLGLFIFQRYLRKVPSKNVLLATSLISIPLGLTQLILVTHLNRTLGIDDRLFALGDTAVLTVLGEIAFMPTLVLASRLCPPGVEGALFATLMSIYNASGVLGTELGAGLTKILNVTESNFDNLSLLIVICNLSTLLPLPLIRLLPHESQQVSGKNDEENP